MNSAWIIRRKINPEARLRLFCFAAAGGSATFYFPLAESLPAEVEVCALELPGRGARLREPAYQRLPDLIAALVEVLPPYLDRPFAFLGHSMGALVAFELARALRREQQPLPVKLWASAFRAPQIPNPDIPARTLADAELVQRIQRLGGTPPEVLQQPELLAFILPALRADFEVLDSYRYVAEPPLACPIMALGGMQDGMISRAQLEAWREQTQAEFTLQMFPGGHFYVQTAHALFVGVLARALAELVS